jgi:hypothetical protein
MTVNEIYNHLGAFLFGLLPDNDWVRAELSIDIQPGSLGMSGYSVKENNVYVSLRPKINQQLKNEIQWLHNLTSEGGKNKWNKAKFTVLPDKKFEMTFEWDEEQQNRIDTYNREAEKNDPSYKAPKWHWEK